MGCQQSVNLRRQSYLSTEERRPIDELCKSTIKIDDCPIFVQQFLYHYKNRQFQYLAGTYKDLFAKNDIIYSVEKMDHVEFCRRRKLYTDIENLRINTIMPTKVHYLNGCLIGEMRRLEVDLFEFLKNDYINLDEFVLQISRIICKLHANGIFMQDFKLENILVDVHDNSQLTYYLCDLDFALRKEDYFHREIIKKRIWVRTPEYTPTIHKPMTVFEAVRNDLYAFAKTIGLIETTFFLNKTYNVFTKKREDIVDDEFDDRDRIIHYKANGHDYRYAEFCADFMLEGIIYKSNIFNFLKTLKKIASTKRADNNSC